MTDNLPKTSGTRSSDGLTSHANVGQDSHFISEEETKKILTPFAFEIDKTLFGIPIAKPWRRAVAIAIDALLIVILSQAPGELLAVVIAVTFFRLGNKKRAKELGKVKGRKRRAISRAVGAFILLVVLLTTLPAMFNGGGSDSDKPAKQEKASILTSEDVIAINSDDLSFKDSILLTAVTASTINRISNSECKGVNCWQKELLPLVQSLSELSLNRKTVEGAIKGMVEATELTEVEQAQLNKRLLEKYQSVGDKSTISESKTASASPILNPEDKSDKAETSSSTINEESKIKKNEDAKEPVYSVIEMVKNLINDLGLEFGWAAFYFTVFTALWNGQTPGKKVTNIKVLQLDGTPLSLMDSFGRYGGYAAGLATGLLGFMQVYWDPNRQAIHDKISATVVIDVKLAIKSKHMNAD